MITLAEAKAAGREDRNDGLAAVELETVAESILENYGAYGVKLADAYRGGAGI